jgi:hypothetical protein
MPKSDSAMHTVDFSDGVHPLVETCRSVVVLLELDDEGYIASPDIGALVAFVPEFDRWYRRMCGFSEGAGRMHLLYRREIGIATAISPRRWEQLRPVAHACRDVGLGFSLTLDLRAAANEVAELTTLLGDSAVRGVSIAFDGDPTLFVQASAALAVLRDAPQAIGFTGPVRTLLDSGILGDAQWCTRHVSIDPLIARSPMDAAQQADACWRRFRLTIDSKGDMYPCFGLMGLAAGRLGNIAQPLEHSVLCGHPAALDLLALAKQGPVLVWSAGLQEAATGLPAVCEQHRAALLSQTL